MGMTMKASTTTSTLIKIPYKAWQDQNEDRFEAELVSKVSKDGTKDES